MAELYHINFHTFRNHPLFLDEAYAREIDHLFADVIRRHQIASLARTLMPNHVHFVVVAFPDQPRERIAQLLKGATARESLSKHPEIDGELGGHLWQAGYDWVLITSNRQLSAAISYVRANRPKVGLPPSVGSDDSDG
jgi:REP element-mobilizing transposase RayT